MSHADRLRFFATDPYLSLHNQAEVDSLIAGAVALDTLDRIGMDLCCVNDIEQHAPEDLVKGALAQLAEARTKVGELQSEIAAIGSALGSDRLSAAEIEQAIRKGNDRFDALQRKVY